MKAYNIISGIVVISCAIIIFATSTAAPPQISVESNHPLAEAQQELEQAHTNYNKGDIEAVQQNLKASKKWLQSAEISKDSKTKNEAAGLAEEIQQLQEMLNHPSDKHQGTLTRLWHRSGALLGREIQHLSKSWSDTTTTNKTMSSLLNARLHFIYAEHELFNSHNAKKANIEINKTITYLDEAKNIATPRGREKIATLKDDILKLQGKHANATKQYSIIHTLEAAKISLEKARYSKNPEIQARINAILVEIKNLSTDVPMLKKRQQYDSIIKRLSRLDELLSDN